MLKKYKYYQIITINCTGIKLTRLYSMLAKYILLYKFYPNIIVKIYLNNMYKAYFKMQTKDNKKILFHNKFLSKYKKHITVLS